VKTKNLPAQAIYNLVFIVVLLLPCGLANAAQHTISGVPDYQNSYWPADVNDCAPTAGACVLGYWDSHGYDNLITGSADYSVNPTGVTELHDFLKVDMGWTESGTSITNIPTGIEETANTRRGYSFSADNYHPIPWTNLKSEINSNRPFVFSILHPYYGSWHSVAGVGYTEDAGGGSGPYYLSAIADSYVYLTEPEQNYGSQTSFFVGKWHDGGEFHAFVKFDLSSIAPGTPIGNATLRLYCPTMSGSDDLAVYLVAESWSESNVTWNNKPGVNLSAYTYHSPQGSNQTWEIDVADHVRQWVNGTATNHGFYLAGRYSPNDNWKAFSSKESSLSSQRPELVVNGGWSDEVVIIHDNWTQYFPYDPDVWLNFNECGDPYLTQVLPGGGIGGDSYEPDNTSSQANEIVSGSPQNHSIVPATDEDWVWFSLSEESEVVVETSGPSGDTRMWLYDNSLTEIEFDDDGGTGNFSRIDRICGADPLSAGTYYVKIDEYDNDDEIASYNIIFTVSSCAGSPGQLQFSNATYDIRENGGIATITVIRTGGSDGAVTVDYEMSDGTAKVDYDYETASGTLDFEDGETSETFNVTILDDDSIENDESINLSLSNLTGGATLGSQDTAVLTIIDNEPDLNRDGRVDFYDFSALAEQWLNNCSEPNWCEGADFDSSSKVDFNDLTTLCEYWLSLRYDILHTFSLDINPGWTVEGEWAFGQPLGGGGVNGNPDPSNGYTGTNVYGVNLNGDYNLSIGVPYYLTTGPFNFSGCSHVNLKFARWLNTDIPPYVRSKIEVSNNGTNWQIVWEHAGAQPITDSTWQVVEYDISAIADNQPTVYVRWGYQIGDEAYSYSGWNIDDIQFWGVR
jgi:hypothetical protein